MRTYAYSRISCKDQKLDRQLIELRKYTDEKYIFSDVQSGKTMDRPQFQFLKKVADKGDIIYIKSLDRLGRDKTQIKDELEHFRKLGVRIKILDIPTTLMEVEGQDWIIDMINNLLIEVLSTIAESERITLLTRQKEGIAAAKAKGVALGRPETIIPENFNLLYDEWKTGTRTAVSIMKELDLKRTTFYKIVKMYELRKCMRDQFKAPLK